MPAGRHAPSGVARLYGWLTVLIGAEVAAVLAAWYHLPLGFGERRPLRRPLRAAGS